MFNNKFILFFIGFVATCALAFGQVDNIFYKVKDVSFPVKARAVNYGKDSAKVYMAVEENYFSFSLIEGKTPEEETYAIDPQVIIEVYNADEPDSPINNYLTHFLDTIDQKEFIDIQNNPGFHIFTKSIHLPEGKKYLLKIEISDANSDTKGYQVVNIDRTNTAPKWDIMLKTSNGLQPVADNYLIAGKTYVIKDRPSDLSLIIYPNDTAIAQPPYLEKKYDPKKPKPIYASRKLTSNEVVIDSRNTVAEFSTGKEGESPVYFYVVPSDMVMPSQIVNPEKVWTAMFYVATPPEYKTLVQSKKVMPDMDMLWKTYNKNNNEFYPYLYYNRAAYANRYLSGPDKDGWQTDRGMAYIVFGPPDAITLRLEGEYWFYEHSPENPDLPLQFFFAKQQHPLGDNCFVLERKLTMQKSWQTMVGKWRKGEVKEEY